MLTKPVAVVLVVTAILIAALVGGYVAQQGTLPNFGQNRPAGNEDLVPVPQPAAAPGTPGTPPSTPPRNSGPSGSKPVRPRPSSDVAGGPPTATSVLPQSGGTPTSIAPVDRGTHVPVFEEIIVPANHVVRLELVSPISSETSKVEDTVEARIAKDVVVEPRVAIPAGARVLGSVTVVDKGGKIKEAARIGVRFHTLSLKGQPDIPLSIEPLIQEGKAPAGGSKLKIGGGAAAGAALGWLLGGTSGAIKGGATGAGGGAAAQMMAKGAPAEVAKGTQADVRLMTPVTVLVEKK